MSGSPPEQPPVDLSSLEETAGGDEEFTRDLIELFLDDAATQLEEIREALSQSDARALARQAHGLKGSSANMGATKLSEIAMSLEMAAEKQVLDQAEDILTELEEEFERVKTHLAEYLG
jgi:HPt (histidine-containing phosphotransfer) domain-containing protein